ncbi:MAG: AMP-binding protein, partial [Desulfobacterales bacterium]
MPAKPIHRTPSAYPYQLLIKNILTTPLIYSPKQEIVYRDRLRYDYETFFNRVTRLAGMLQQQGVQPGDTVAIMDWDSHRYLECFFAVPMMGAVLHTINIRLSTEQLLYTINHAEDDVILVNAEFLRVLEGVKDQFETIKKIILLTDADDTPETSLAIEGEYETLLGKHNDGYNFPDF